jgi:hypothetical protein
MMVAIGSNSRSTIPKIDLSMKSNGNGRVGKIKKRMKKPSSLLGVKRKNGLLNIAVPVRSELMAM